jgi:hypothetical protein
MMDNSEKYFKEAQKIIDANKKYMIKADKVEELKEGKTTVYISKIVPFSRSYLNEFFSRARATNIKSVCKIINPLIAESVKLSNMYNEKGMNYMINYFFEQI